MIPFPLKERVRDANSGIWGRNSRFQAGEFIQIIAASGSGKSTLIHAIYGLRKDYEGRVLLDGQDIRLLDPEGLSILRRKRLSIVFQDLRLFPNLSARENIIIKQCLEPAYPQGQLLEFSRALGIETLLDQPAATLSFGERQRVTLVRCLMQPFDWLLLDEPFSHLDQNNIRKAVDLIGEVCRSRRAGLLRVDLEEDFLLSYDQKLNL